MLDGVGTGLVHWVAGGYIFSDLAFAVATHIYGRGINESARMHRFSVCKEGNCERGMDLVGTGAQFHQHGRSRLGVGRFA